MPAQVGVTTTSCSLPKLVMLVVLVFCDYPEVLPVSALIDSGATGVFSDEWCIERLHVPTVALETPIPVQAIDGHPIGKG